MKLAGTNSYDEWIRGWVRCVQSGPPYRFPDDAIDDAEHISLADHRAFIKSDVFGRRDDTRLHLGLIPQPYIGNLKAARLILLSLNPGLNPGEYAYDKNEIYRQTLIHNLEQKLGPHDFPFIFLNPEFAWHSGFSYWTKHLRGLIEAVREEGWANTFNDALAFLSQRIACVELVPYHSVKGAPVTTPIPASSQHAANYVNFMAGPRAERNECSLLAIRQAYQWKQRCAYVTIHQTNSAQSGSVSKGNCKSWNIIMDILRPKS